MSKYLYGLDLSWSAGISIYDLEEHKFVYVDKIDVSKVKLTKGEKDRYLTEHGKKLRLMANKMRELTEEYAPFFVVYEGLFSNFKKETIALSKIHGVFNEMFADIPTSILQPTSVKAKILHGKATKEQLKEIILERFPYIDFSNDEKLDKSDAVAVALAHMIDVGFIEWEKPEPKVVKVKKSTTKKATKKVTKTKEKKGK